MSIFPRLNQRTKILLPIRTNLATYNEIPEHTVISSNTEIPSVQDGPTVVARYRNLTISYGATLTTSNRCCGLVLVVDGDLTVNGTISMTARGANFQPTQDHRLTNELLPGKEVYYEIDIPATADEIAAFLLRDKRMYRSVDELPAIYRPTLYARGPVGNVYAPADLGVIPAVGGAGGAGRANTNGNGSAGTAGTDRKCGGGGGGGVGGGGGTGGNGSAGTCFSGGTGGGGAWSSIGLDGSNYGGSGGNGTASSNNYAGGGAGNPGGAGSGTGTTSGGGAGTGGLLVVICTGKVTVASGGSIAANGSSGGVGAAAGGGGSGGGSVNLFYGTLENNGTITATGGAGGSGGAGNGGAGGAGCVTLDQYNF